jgi:hypothetical protein
MKNKLILITITIFISHVVFSQNEQEFNPNITYPADSLKVWTKGLMKILKENQPGFYRYTSKTDFDRSIDSTINTIKQPLKPIEYYRKLKPLIAKIGCLHTGIQLSEDFTSYIENSYTLFPFEIFIDENEKVFITKNHSSNPEIKIKSELISINKQPITEIVTTLMNAIPSDGYNQTLKTLYLNHRFSFWYQTVMYLGNKYELEIKNEEGKKTYTLDGVSKDKFESIEELSGVNEPQLEFTIEGKNGFLTIQSFAKSTIRANDQKFKKFIKKVFKTLKEENIQNLVIDLRYNTGGSDSNAVFLASHFFDKPFRYWDRIEVTETIASQIKGLDRLFYKKPEKVDSTYLWKKGKLTKEFDFYEVQKPSKNNFEGNVYVITNGLCMSSCADFVAILSSNKKATIIGQETGGGYQGNTSGMMPEATVTKFMTVTIPLQKYYNYVDTSKNFGRGTIPDVVVYPTLEEWMSKTEIEMVATKKLINQN